MPRAASVEAPPVSRVCPRCGWHRHQQQYVCHGCAAYLASSPVDALAWLQEVLEAAPGWSLDSLQAGRITASRTDAEGLTWTLDASARSNRVSLDVRSPGRGAHRLQLAIGLQLTAFAVDSTTLLCAVAAAARVAGAVRDLSHLQLELAAP